MRRVEDLEVWRRSYRLCREVYQLLEDSNRYSLRDQLERSALSVVSNIAEGQDRGTDAEFVRFLQIAKGSCAELRTQLRLAGDLGIIATECETKLRSESQEISRMLVGLIRSL